MAARRDDVLTDTARATSLLLLPVALLAGASCDGWRRSSRRGSARLDCARIEQHGDSASMFEVASHGSILIKAFAWTCNGPSTS
jgi:hypothetical protein